MGPEHGEFENFDKNSCLEHRSPATRAAIMKGIPKQSKLSAVIHGRDRALLQSIKEERQFVLNNNFLREATESKNAPETVMRQR
ncbi:hypothetical protein IFM47457_05764 [Aspergillus lentulus]|nr:hypothetical protein IFM47457_05764 [Aspergillus lentulus]